MTRKLSGADDSFQRQRKKRMNITLNELEQAKDIERSRFIDKLSWERGWRRDTISEYVDIFENLGFIEIDENDVIHFKGREINNVSKR